MSHGAKGIAPRTGKKPKPKSTQPRSIVCWIARRHVKIANCSAQRKTDTPLTQRCTSYHHDAHYHFGSRPPTDVWVGKAMVRISSLWFSEVLQHQELPPRWAANAARTSPGCHCALWAWGCWGGARAAGSNTGGRTYHRTAPGPGWERRYWELSELNGNLWVRPLGRVSNLLFQVKSPRGPAASEASLADRLSQDDDYLEE